MPIRATCTPNTPVSKGCSVQTHRNDRKIYNQTK
nr:MAG TPA: hypothetical protein [Inoviridae sp.]